MTPTTCAGCSLLCNDSPINPAASPVSACPVAVRWWERGRRPRLEPSIAGKAVSVDDAVAEAVRLMKAARYPAYFGIEHLPCEQQRHVVALADATGGVVALADEWPQMPGVGDFGTTLGEVRDRADVIVFWGCDPVATHPRLTERLALPPSPPALRGGGVGGEGDSHRKATAGSQPPPSTDREATAGSQPPPPPLPQPLPPAKPGGRGAGRRLTVEGQSPEAVWQLRADICADVPGLAAQLRAARYVVVLCGDPAAWPALQVLVADLNEFTHARLVALEPGAANRVGARQVLGWQTGYHAGTAFHRGHPHAAPGDYTPATLLRPGGCDLAVCIDGDLTPPFGPTAPPVVAFAAHPSPITDRAAVAVPIPPEPARGGSFGRFDHLLLPLVPPDRASPADADRVWIGCLDLLR